MYRISNEITLACDWSRINEEIVLSSITEHIAQRDKAFYTYYMSESILQMLFPDLCNKIQFLICTVIQYLHNIQWLCNDVLILSPYNEYSPLTDLIKKVEQKQG
jgi:hypothetical protein